jgi:hypothetical protein
MSTFTYQTFLILQTLLKVCKFRSFWKVKILIRKYIFIQNFNSYWSSSVVEYSADNIKIEGLNPAISIWREKIYLKKGKLKKSCRFFNNGWKLLTMINGQAFSSMMSIKEKGFKTLTLCINVFYHILLSIVHTSLHWKWCWNIPCTLYMEGSWERV